MGKTPCCEKIGLRRGKWTSEEDEILIKYIHANGEGSWRSLPKNAGLLRCGKSCRLRWINYLKDDLKRGNFTHEEEEVIVKLHRSLGNRWSAIASHLPGRTDNEVKNYWNSHLSRKCYMFFRTKRNSTRPSVETYNMNNRLTKRVGRVSRKFAKKYQHNRVPNNSAIPVGNSDDQTMGSNSVYVNENMKESQNSSNEIMMAEIDELGFLNDEPIDMNFVLEGDDTIGSNGLLWNCDKDHIEKSLTKVDFESFKMNACNVNDKEDKESRSNSSQNMEFCFGEDLLSNWEMGVGFHEGINMCDSYDDGGIFLGYEGSNTCDSDDDGVYLWG